jgi:hypothetical protein
MRTSAEIMAWTADDSLNRCHFGNLNYVVEIWNVFQATGSLFARKQLFQWYPQWQWIFQPQAYSLRSIAGRRDHKLYTRGYSLVHV